MYFGELSSHSSEYQCGHETGSIRAYDDAISFFERRLSSDTRLKKQSYTNQQVIDILKVLKDSWLQHCDTFGMANEEDC